MIAYRFVHKTAAALVGAALLGALSAQPSAAAEKFTFLTSWFAQAEHGGFYQAKATGLYKKAGLDVTIKMGGPQINGLQLLLAGEADAIIGYDFQVLNGVEKGLPVVTIAASFQHDVQGIMAHKDIKSMADLKGHTILLASSSHTTFWPWLKQKYGFTDDQVQPYTFNLQPFFANPKVAQQAYPSSEPFQAEQKGVPVNFFLFADDGYPPYGTTIVTTRAEIEKHPDAIAKFVKASMEGWKSYLHDPAPGNALIKEANPQMSDAQIAYGIKKMKAMEIVTGGDAAKSGIGTMTEARWKATADYMVKSGLLKADTDWHKAYTLQFVKDINVAAK